MIIFQMTKSINLIGCNSNCSFSKTVGGKDSANGFRPRLLSPTAGNNLKCTHLIYIFFAFLFSSCNTVPDSIPFPKKELSYAKPVSIPMVFAPEKKLTWDTVKQGGVKSVIKKLDINTLPSASNDSNGFRPFAQAPEEVQFDFNKLPEASCNLADLTSIPLQFKTTVLAPPTIMKALPPASKKGKAIAIFDFSTIQNLQVKFITYLLKDADGLMWIATDKGLYRYDGEYLKVYIPGPLTNFISGMSQDNKGNIWFTQFGSIGMINPHIGTIQYSKKIGSTGNNLSKIFKDETGLLWVYNHSARAVSIIDPETLSFKNLDKKAGLSDSSSFEILQDLNKNIWISTNTGGVNIINLKAGKIKYLTKANGLSSDTLSAIAMDKSGKVWISEATGKLNAVDVKRGIIKHYKPFKENSNSFTFYLTIDYKGRLWKGGSDGLEIIDPQNAVHKFLNKNDGLAGRTVLSCTPDNNRMWIATNEGLNLIDQNAETIHPMATTNIVCMMNDEVDNLWVGTTAGIKIINFKNNSIKSLDKSNGLGHEFVQSFTKYHHQMLVATNGGMDIIDPMKKTIEHTGKNSGLASDSIYTMFKDDGGNTWLTGPTSGINIIDSSRKIIRNVSVKGGLSDNNVIDARQDQDGMIWLSTAFGGVNVIDMQNGTVKYLNNLPGLKDTCNRILLLDQYGRIWIGTDKGIYVADKKLGTITTISTKEGLSNNNIVSLLEYKDGVIAATNNKVNIITAPPPSGAIANAAGKEWKIAVLDKSEGLAKETSSWNVDCITKTGQYLWGDKGITVINEIKPNSDSVSTYITGMNVMTNPQHFANKLAAIEKDTLWTADSFYVKGQKPVLYGYAANNKFTWDSVSGPYNMPVNLQIPYNNNYIQFQFVQAHLGRQDTTWYTYILEGVDKNWSSITSNTATENYLNLSPGNYTFRVSSKGLSGKWSTPAAFNFTISPPWYKTWWAYTLWALIVIGLLRAYIVYRSRKLQEENKVLEEKVEQRTKQLQQSLEDLKATQTQLVQSEKMASLGELTAGIAHEIQNPLNFINNFSEVNAELITEMKQEIEKGNFEDAITIANDIETNEQKIVFHGKRADVIVKGMLQHSRSSSGLKEPTDINELADEYLRLSYHGLRAKDKSFNATMKTDFDPSIEKIKVIPQDIGRVILNLLTNAFYVVNEKKQLNISGYEPTVSISTKRVDGKVEIRVSDNGNGIPPKVLDKIFQPFFTTKPTGQGTGLGLSLSYDVVTQGHGGILKVETREGEGTTFIIILQA